MVMFAGKLYLLLLYVTLNLVFLFLLTQKLGANNYVKGKLILCN